LNGTDVSTLSRDRLAAIRNEQIGFVFQGFNLLPRTTALENVEVPLVYRKMARAERDRRALESLALVGLAERADHFPTQLSGGQQQRVAIARAIVIEPPLVLMDEPLSNLDAKLRLEMRAEIRRIHTLVGSTTIYVTHDQDEALSLADRIVVLRDGMVRQVGTPAELYARPAHADVAEFMGYRNLVPSRAFASGNGTMSVTVAGAAIKGTPLETLADGPVTVAIRPDDLTPRAEGPIVATVATAEYRGRDFYGTATAGDDTELFFRSEQKVAPGEVLALGADAPRVLIYAGAPA